MPFQDPPSRRLGNPFYTYTHDIVNTSSRHQGSLQGEQRVKAEVEEERVRAGLALRPEEMRQEPVKKANKKALKALGFDGNMLTQRRSSVLSRTSSKGSSRASSKGEQATSSKGERSDESSSDEDVDVDSFAGSAQAAFSSRSHSQSLPNSAPESSLQQECTRPSNDKFSRGPRSEHLHLLQVQFMDHDDADEGSKQHRWLPSRSSSTMPASSTVSMQGVLNRVSRRFSNTEVDPWAAQNHTRAQSCGNVSLDGSSLGLELSGCLSSSTDAYALLTKQLTMRASCGTLSTDNQGPAPGATPTPFGSRASQQAPTTPRSAFSRRSVESVAVNVRGVLSSTDPLPSAFQSTYTRRSGGAAAVGAVGARGRSSGADACVPNAIQRSRRVSFVEGAPSAPLAAAAAATGHGTAAEGQAGAATPLRARSSSSEKLTGGSTQAAQPTSSFRPSSPRALQPTRRASASAVTVAVGPAAGADGRAVAGAVPKQQQPGPKRTQSTSRLSFMAGSANALRDLFAP